MVGAGRGPQKLAAGVTPPTTAPPIMTARMPTHSGVDNPAVPTEAQRVITTLEDNHGRLWMPTLVSRLDVSGAELQAALSHLKAHGLVTVRDRDGAAHVVLNNLRVSRARARGRL